MEQKFLTFIVLSLLPFTPVFGQTDARRLAAIDYPKSMEFRFSVI